jgi:hypothetical protein
MAKLFAGGLAAIVTYLLSVALYFAVALLYGVGLRPLVYGAILELLTGFLAMGLVRRERPGVTWLTVLAGIVVGRSLRGMAEVSVLSRVGGLSAASSVVLVGVRVLLVVIGAVSAVAYRRWRSQRSIA